MSKRRPVVGIPACIKTIGPHDFHVIGRKYVDAVLHAAGCTPVLLPALGSRQDIAQLLDMLDGVLLTGSPSMVEPARYGQSPQYDNMHLDTERDATTFPLIEAVLAAGIPLMGICRGFQELNVALGGSLHQVVHDVPGRMDHREPKDQPLDVQYGPSHPVVITAGGPLQGILGGAAQIQVNSIHSQGVDRLADGLSAEAIAPDGQIEAVWVKAARSFALAVQWHPEWKVADNPDSMKIFTAFGTACRAHHELT
jgi:putative glutamine amidotransferase